MNRMSRDEAAKFFEGTDTNKSETEKEIKSRDFMRELILDVYDVVEKKHVPKVEELEKLSDPGMVRAEIIAKALCYAMDIVTHLVLKNDKVEERECFTRIITQHVMTASQACHGDIGKLLELMLKAQGVIPSDAAVKVMDTKGKKGDGSGAKEFLEFMEKMSSKGNVSSSLPKETKNKLH